ncbi:MAG TPA: tetratricopeptide repeat protein [Thermoanaerobaculia bacterium]|nr:tetratricopeptide repeat protein [Thermoanaerobaculia bacterium]
MTAGVLLLAAAGVVLGSATGIPVGVMAVPSPGPASGDPVVSLLIEVPAEPLLAGALQNGAARPAVEGEIWALAQGADGSTVDAFVQPFRLSARGPQGDPSELGVKLLASLRLPPGTYRLQVTVSSATGLSGAVATPLTVPDFVAGEAAASPPLFADRHEGWQVIHQAASPHPLELPVLPEATVPRVPSVIGEVPLGAPASFYLITHNVSEWGSALDAHVVDREGQPTPVAARVVERREGAVSGQELVAVELEAQPPAPGLYWLDLGVPGVARRVRAPLHFVAARDSPWWRRVDVAAFADSEESLESSARPESDPADLGDVLPDVLPDVLREEEEQPAGALTPQEMAGRYNDVLRALADGDQDGALEALGRLETAVATAPSGPGLARLRRVQRRMIDDLVGRGPGLLPVIDLHARLDPVYLSRDDARLSAENRVFVAELVGLWVEAERSADARRLGGLLLAAIGAAHQALEIDPSSSLALFRLSMAAEKAGQLETATSYLWRLLEVAPDDRHARIRLAVVLRRLERPDEARAALSALTAPRLEASKPPRWITALAFQELAMLERDAGRLGRAEQALRRGIEETGAQSLHLLRAYYLDLLQRQGESVAALDDLPVDATAVQAAPRHRYSSPPDSELAAAREEIARAVEERLDRLQASLRADPDQTTAEGR